MQCQQLLHTDSTTNHSMTTVHRRHAMQIHAAQITPPHSENDITRQQHQDMHIGRVQAIFFIDHKARFQHSKRQQQNLTSYLFFSTRVAKSIISPPKLPQGAEQKIHLTTSTLARHSSPHSPHIYSKRTQTNARRLKSHRAGLLRRRLGGLVFRSAHRLLIQILL